MSSLIGPAGERAWFRTVSAWGVQSITHDVAELDEGFHVVVMSFEGELTAIRMKHVVFHDAQPWEGARASRELRDRDAAEGGLGALPAPDLDEWATSLDRAEYEHAVDVVRERVAAGTVYQVNACRVLSRPGAEVDMDGLFADILRHNPAPYAARLDIEGHLDVVSASPELFLAREGRSLASAPIKGTADRAENMLDKDVAENVMITDLVRNDMQRVCDPGSVLVDPFLATEHHPGLVHLVSTVRGRLREDADWRQIFAATFPPGSVSGAPKSSALSVIAEIEAQARGPYCGAIGWIDGETRRAELAVGIRTFWRAPTGNESDTSPITSSRLSFGTGAGITWGSDPSGEWEETQLKARRLVALAQRHTSREKL